jgi:hypothetical protein
MSPRSRPLRSAQCSQSFRSHRRRVPVVSRQYPAAVSNRIATTPGQEVHPCYLT